MSGIDDCLQRRQAVVVHLTTSLPHSAVFAGGVTSCGAGLKRLSFPGTPSLIGGKQDEMRRSEIVLRVVNHTSHHRGFVADMFCQVPARPPLTDLPVFLTAG